MTWYPHAEQDRHYRAAARDRGCTCPEPPFGPLPAGVHVPTCPLYSPAADVLSDGARPVSSTSEAETMPREAGEDSPSLGAGDLDPDWHLDRDPL